MEMTTTSRKKFSPRVDLTPMVDLAFLLLTFFMLASSLTKPRTMEILKPDASGEPSPYPESKTATILLGTRDKAYTYELPDEVSDISDIVPDSMGYGRDGLRKYIQRRQAEVEQKWGDKNLLFVIIKPLPDAPYVRIIDVLDEMAISQVSRYAIVEPNSSVDSMVVDLVNEHWKIE